MTTVGHSHARRLKISQRRCAWLGLGSTKPSFEWGGRCGCVRSKTCSLLRAHTHTHTGLDQSHAIILSAPILLPNEILERAGQTCSCRTVFLSDWCQPSILHQRQRLPPSLKSRQGLSLNESIKTIEFNLWIIFWGLALTLVLIVMTERPLITSQGATVLVHKNDKEAQTWSKDLPSLLCVCLSVFLFCH